MQRFGVATCHRRLPVDTKTATHYDFWDCHPESSATV
nr:MAG TPA: hypothetical protein [Caudoviricetes sp.]